MIKTQWLAKRKAGMTIEAFADHMLTVHGPTAAALQGTQRVAVSIMRPDYHRAETVWDGLTNIWWGGADALAAAQGSDAYHRMVADQANFADVSASGSLIVHEINPVAPKVPPAPDPELFKIVNPLHKRDDLSYAAFSAYWSGPHAAINGELPHMNAYIQNHVHPDFEALPRACDGIAESWFASWDEIRALSKSEANVRLKADEPNLLAPDSLHPMICREYQIS